MAENTTRRIIEVGTGNSAKSLGELRQAVIDAKNAAKDLAESIGENYEVNEEYQQALVRVKDAQGRYNQEMRISVKENQAAKESYNDLVNKLARLKEEWKNTSDATKRGELTKRINETKGTLEAMDHSIGNWQRNVGNYGNSIASVAGLFGSAGKQAAGAIGGIKGMTMGLKAMSATPVIAILGVLVSLLSRLSGEFKSSEENAYKFNLIMAPFRAIADAAKKSMQDLSSAIADFGLALMGVDEEVEKSTSKLALFQAKLQVLATVLGSSSAFWRKLGESMAENSQRTMDNIEITQREMDVAKLRREVLVENAKEEQRASELRAQAMEKDSRSLIDRVAKLEEVKSLELSISRRNIELAQKELALAELKAAQTDNDAEANDALAQARAKVIQQTTAYHNKLRELNSQIAEINNQINAGVSVADVNEAYGATVESVKALVAEEKKAAKERHDTFVKANAERLAEVDKQEKRELAYNAIKLQSDKEREDAAFEIQQKSNERRLALLNEYKAQALAQSDTTAFLDYLQQQADLEYQIEYDKQARIAQLRKESTQGWINASIQTANAIAGVLDTVAGAYEDEINRRVEAGEITEEQGKKEFENVKKMQIAVATIQMLTGITAAISGLFTTKSGPWDIALAAVQAASIAATGAININKIKNTQYGKTASGSVSSAQTKAPAVVQTIPQTRVVTNAEDERKLNTALGEQKVYVVYSDIEGAGRKVAVQQAESTF